MVWRVSSGEKKKDVHFAYLGCKKETRSGLIFLQSLKGELKEWQGYDMTHTKELRLIK